MTDDEINEKIAKWLLANNNIDWTDVKKVISVEDETYYGGYCETCAYEEERLTVQYLDNDDNRQRLSTYYEFSDCLKMLLRGEIDD